MRPKPSLTISKEQQEQDALLLWCETCPDLRVSFLYSRVSKAESAGFRSSLPKYYLPVPCGQFQGLYIDMPADVNSLSKVQTTWLKALSDQECKVVFCSDHETAITAILNYLRIERRR